MKKLLSLITVMVFFTAFANAQTTHRFTVDQLLPSNPTILANQGYAITDSFVITLVQGNLTPTDTFAFGSPITINAQNQPVVILRWGQTKNQGDTIHVSYTNGVSFGQGGSFDYCVRAFMFDRNATSLYPSTFDTMGWRDCTTMTVTEWPASTNDYFVRNENLSKQPLNIFPNPVVGNEVGVDFVSRNSKNIDFTVFDLTGRKVMNNSFKNNFKGQNGYKIDISDLNTGMYILELRQDGIKATGQFVK